MPIHMPIHDMRCTHGMLDSSATAWCLQACLVLRMLSEEVTWMGEAGANSEAPEARRALLSALVGTLNTALPFLHGCLESHFIQASQALTSNDQEIYKAHSATVKAALSKPPRPFPFLPSSFHVSCAKSFVCLHQTDFWSTLPYTHAFCSMGT